MTSFRKLRFSTDAREDLRDISRHTRKVWGVQQRERYLVRLNRTFEELRRYPEIGSISDKGKPGLRAHVVVQHVIYYRYTDEALLIVKIAHIRMDPDRVARSDGGDA